MVLIYLCTLFAPACAFAHATPTSYIPDASSVVPKAPAQVTIHFSENVDPNASSISVADPSGALASKGDAHVVNGDRRTLAIAVTDKGNGAYRVSWSVVSADDGHFTRGGYVFVVGKGTPTPAVDTSSIELVENTTVPEALGMSIELMGNGLIWAVIALWVFAIRPLHKRAKDEQKTTLNTWYVRLLFFSVMLIAIGGIVQIGVKVDSLASLRGGSFVDSLPLYLATAAGQANLWRLTMGLVVGVLVFVFGKKITNAAKSTLAEWGIILAMCVFAYFRAKISHATANPFHPGFSIAVNFFHLVEKDIWAGLVGILCLMSFSKKMHSFFLEVLPSVFAMLAVNVGAVTVTACYIIWLHLKSWDNLFTTEWGDAFLKLLCAAVLIVGFRVYHTLAYSYKPRFCMRHLPLTLAGEFALGILVVYFSSVTILTSPPLSTEHDPILSVRDQGIHMSLSLDPYEDGMLLLTIEGASKHAVLPAVTVAQGGATEPVSVELTQRFPGGYVFPLSLLDSRTNAIISATVPQNGGYDAHALFSLQPENWASVPPLGYRPLDAFAYVFIVIAFMGVLFSVLLFKLAKRIGSEASLSMPRSPRAAAVAGFTVALCIAGAGIGAFGSSALANPFKAQCEADGNMWHLMLPTKAGVPVAQTPQEGCMWGMGQYMYMFPDRREYSYLAALPKAEVSLKHVASIQAGVPTTFTVKLQEPDGSPAKLFVDMEKLVHLVIVSQDEKVFAHIHADDTHPLTPDEIRSSTFTFKYTFPKAGTYLISADYAHGLSLESKQFAVEVKGASGQEKEPATYPLSGTFDGYDVSLSYGGVALAGEVTTLRYTITKSGLPVTNLEQYLSAAMHVSVVKNDLGVFMHTHGEVHPPGAPYPPIIIKNGQVVHSMAMMLLPPTFGPNIEAHLIFPSTGEYTVWGEFKAEGKVIPTSFTIRVD